MLDVYKRQFEDCLAKESMQSDSPYIQALAQTWYEAGRNPSMARVSQERTLEKLAELDFWWREPEIEKQKLCFLEKGSEEKV